MSEHSTVPWESIEKRSATAFLVAGVLFLLDAALVGAVIGGAGDRLMILGQALIGAGWTAGFVGLLGSYPDLVARSKWVARAGLAFAGIGVVVFVVMSIASLGYFTGVLDGGLSSLVPIFLPGVIIGSVLGFLTFGAGSIRTGIHSRGVGGLLVVLGLFPVANILSGIVGLNSEAATLAIVVGLALVNLTVSYRLRTESVPTTGVESPRDASP